MAEVDPEADAGTLLGAAERVLLIDPKERRYLLTLVAGTTFHTHAGVIAHDDIIGQEEGCTITGSTGPLQCEGTVIHLGGPRSSIRRIWGPSSSQPTSVPASACSRRVWARGRCR